jgi:endo-1,4-beta-xylanase
VVAIVKHVKSRGIHIDGIGIQLQGSLTHLSAEGLEYAITSLAAADVKVMITEPDIRTRTRGYRGADVSRINRWRTRDSNVDTPENQNKLAEKYTKIFSVLVKHRKDVTHVTFWGVYDGAIWIGSSPLLFDRKYEPKEAFFSVVKTTKNKQ